MRINLNDKINYARFRAQADARLYECIKFAQIHHGEFRPVLAAYNIGFYRGIAYVLRLMGEKPIKDISAFLTPEGGEK